MGASKKFKEAAECIKYHLRVLMRLLIGFKRIVVYLKILVPHKQSVLSASHHCMMRAEFACELYCRRCCERGRGQQCGGGYEMFVKEFVSHYEYNSNFVLRFLWYPVKNEIF